MSWGQESPKHFFSQKLSLEIELYARGCPANSLCAGRGANSARWFSNRWCLQIVNADSIILVMTLREELTGLDLDVVERVAEEEIGKIGKTLRETKEQALSMELSYPGLMKIVEVIHRLNRQRGHPESASMVMEMGAITALGILKAVGEELVVDPTAKPQMPEL